MSVQLFNEIVKPNTKIIILLVGICIKLLTINQNSLQHLNIFTKSQWSYTPKKQSRKD